MAHLKATFTPVLQWHAMAERMGQQLYIRQGTELQALMPDPAAGAWAYLRLRAPLVYAAPERNTRPLANEYHLRWPLRLGVLLPQAAPHLVEQHLRAQLQAFAHAKLSLHLRQAWLDPEAVWHEEFPKLRPQVSLAGLTLVALDFDLLDLRFPHACLPPLVCHDLLC